MPRSPRPAALALALLFAASGATAQQAGGCPSGAEARQGGVYVDLGELVLHYQPLPDGRVRETEFYDDDGALVQFISLPSGVYVESWEVDGGRILPNSVERFSYSSEAGPPPARPEPGQGWQGRESAVFAGGGSGVAEIELRFGGRETLAIGPCRYEAIPITETRREGGTATARVNHFQHVPALGITMYLGGEDLGQTPDLLRPRSIGLRPPMAPATGDATQVPPMPPPSK